VASPGRVGVALAGAVGLALPLGIWLLSAPDQERSSQQVARAVVEGRARPRAQAPRPLLETSPLREAPVEADLAPPPPPPSSAERAELEPSEAAISALEAAQDAPSLLKLIAGERSLVRDEACRRYLEQEGPRGLRALTELALRADARGERDPRLAGIVGEALAAGVTPELALRVAEWLPSVRDPALRISLAGGLWEARFEQPLAPWAVDAARQQLRALARDAELAEVAVAAMASAPETELLLAVAYDPAVTSGARLSAAEALTRLDPIRAGEALEQLSLEDTAVGRQAARHAQRLGAR
jgi:hypothetical protein